MTVRDPVPAPRPPSFLQLHPDAQARPPPLTCPSTPRSRTGTPGSRHTLLVPYQAGTDAHPGIAWLASLVLGAGSACARPATYPGINASGEEPRDVPESCLQGYFVHAPAGARRTTRPVRYECAQIHVSTIYTSLE